MGLFDYVKCEYPLPDGEDGSCLEFQTKDFDDPYMNHYCIRDDGTLWLEGEQIPFHGDLEFYTSNVNGSSPRGCLTRNNEPATFWNYVARFTEGKVTSIKGQKSYGDPAEYKVISREEFFKE